ncbi:MAG: ATP-binding protein [Candidatus Kapabacteria bacterium]|nr:ATP-binding protein [Ignavibacteriota bacterium]MCW5885068.1 ATP-binding protein [Candidatus Kapabacteria bacterium]
MAGKSNKDQCFCTLSGSQELEKIRNFVFECSVKFGFDNNISNKIALAVDEACSNLIKYAYNNNSNNEIKVKINKNETTNYLIVKIEDDSQPFNPLSIESPDMVDYFKHFRKGGLGIHIMKLVMDEIEYIPKTNFYKYNTLILKKRLN